ncbi:uncharacterized protein LAESUDRAFT_513700 [Laetiporus sulphureus 93-53]|uniref:Uncharacterized protein n=1 Tax=Laetiporus sulphureus 93-53 TaxID=1314785 RepID=A0A165FZJ2_9APHY|nr:uncharacterized protein LAESUDRAFT_513700 [Laetiporus sulphureus 93-53]KZT09624.1 hypothetical protein LAESUDRAFT_513700 [Laetiporus sulphureus 93-53]
MDEYSDHSRSPTSSSQGGGHQVVDLPPVPARLPSLTELCAQCARRFTANSDLRTEVPVCDECRRRPSRERGTSALRNNFTAYARPSDVPQRHSSDDLPRLRDATYDSENTRESTRGRPFPAANRGPSSSQFPHGVRPSELPDVTLNVGSPGEESVLHQALRRR